MTDTYMDGTNAERDYYSCANVTQFIQLLISKALSLPAPFLAPMKPFRRNKSTDSFALADSAPLIRSLARSLDPEHKEKAIRLNLKCVVLNRNCKEAF